GMGGDKSLHIGGDLSTQTDFIVTVSFGGQYVGATDVSFKIFDIDEGNDHDRIINNYATAANGLTSVAPTISDLGSTVQLTGSGLGQVLTGYGASPDAGVDSANGNATISFGSTSIQSFTFDFKNTSGPPRFQDIGLFDLNFTPVPEMNPAWLAGLSCLAAGFLILRHNARVRK
nr:hypothetical protein [Verrucomicrobiota bacterium]